MIDKAAESVLCMHVGRHHALHDVSGAIAAEDIADSADGAGWCVDGYFSLPEHGQSRIRLAAARRLIGSSVMTIFSKGRVSN